MNGSVCRILRRYANDIGIPVRYAKRLWNLTPRPNRHIVRERLEAYEKKAQKG